VEGGPGEGSTSISVKYPYAPEKKYHDRKLRGGEKWTGLLGFTALIKTQTVSTTEAEVRNAKTGLEGGKRGLGSIEMGIEFCLSKRLEQEMGRRSEAVNKCVIFISYATHPTENARWKKVGDGAEELGEQGKPQGKLSGEGRLKK